MASVLSDDEGEERPHPLAQERPGVYVQVVAPRRRKARKSQEVAPPEPAPAAQAEVRPAHMAELVAADAPALGDILGSAIDAHPKARSEPAPAPESERPSGEREIIAEAPAGYVRSISQNSNGGADGVVITLPPPPRMPNFMGHGLTHVEREFARTAAEPGPSVLDAPTSLQPAPTRAKRTPWGMISFVAALAAILASAVVVAFRGSDGAADVASSDPAADVLPAENPAPESARSQPARVAPAASSAPTVAVSAAAAPPANPAPAPSALRKLPVTGPGGVIAPPPGAPAAIPAAPAPRPGAGLAAAPAGTAPRPVAAAPAPAAAAVRPLPAAPKASAKPAAPASAPATAPTGPDAPSELPDNPYAE